MITVLSGGIGAARFARALIQVVPRIVRHALKRLKAPSPPKPNQKPGPKKPPPKPC